MTGRARCGGGGSGEEAAWAPSGSALCPAAAAAAAAAAGGGRQARRGDPCVEPRGALPAADCLGGRQGHGCSVNRQRVPAIGSGRRMVALLRSRSVVIDWGGQAAVDFGILGMHDCGIMEIPKLGAVYQTISSSRSRESKSVRKVHSF